ncbi:MAG: hypothetical protein OES14_02890, partial [Nitrosopumilus sp.]|nr:hypothetical protein [Nitrosopumilus sp.]
MILSIGEPTRDKNSWKLLAAMIKGIKLDFTDQKISSLVTYNPRDLSTKDYDWIVKQGNVISELITKSQKTKKPERKTPTFTPMRNMAILLLGVSILTPSIFYPDLASAYWDGASQQSFADGDFE